MSPQSQKNVLFICKEIIQKQNQTVAAGRRNIQDEKNESKQNKGKSRPHKQDQPT